MIMTVLHALHDHRNRSEVRRLGGGTGRARKSGRLRDPIVALDAPVECRELRIGVSHVGGHPFRDLPEVVDADAVKHFLVADTPVNRS